MTIRKASSGAGHVASAKMGWPQDGNGVQNLHEPAATVVTVVARPPCHGERQQDLAVSFYLARRSGEGEPACAYASERVFSTAAASRPCKARRSMRRSPRSDHRGWENVLGTLPSTSA